MSVDVGDRWTKDQAVAWLTSYLVGHYAVGPGSSLPHVLRVAEKKSHPDRGGEPIDFKRVQKARQLLLG